MNTVLSKIEGNIIWIGLGLCAAFWALDAAVHAFLFQESNFADQVFSPSSTSIWIRTLVSFILISSSSFIQSILSKRKRAVEALRESERKFSSLFHLSNEAIFIHDLSGNMIDVNNKAAELFGYGRTEMLSMKVLQLHPASVLPDSRKAFDAIQREGAVNLELDFVRKDATVFSAELSASVIDLGGGKVIQGLVRDITERKLAEERLLKSEAKTRAILNAIPDMVFQLDRNGTFLSYKGAKKDLVLPEENFIGVKIVNVMPSYIADQVLTHIKQALATREIQVFEYQLEINDEMRQYESRMTACNGDEVVAIIRDITGRHKSEYLQSEEASRA